MIYHIESIDPAAYTFGTLHVLKASDDTLDSELEKIEIQHKETVIHGAAISKDSHNVIQYLIIWSTISPREQKKHKTIDDITNELTALGKRIEEASDPVELKTLKEEALVLLKEIVHRLTLLDEIKGGDMQ